MLEDCNVCFKKKKETFFFFNACKQWLPLFSERTAAGRGRAITLVRSKEEGGGLQFPVSVVLVGRVCIKQPDSWGKENRYAEQYPTINNAALPMGRHLTRDEQTSVTEDASFVVMPPLMLAVSFSVFRGFRQQHHRASVLMFNSFLWS